MRDWITAPSRAQAGYNADGRPDGNVKEDRQVLLVHGREEGRGTQRILKVYCPQKSKELVQSYTVVDGKGEKY